MTKHVKYTLNTRKDFTCIQERDMKNTKPLEYDENNVWHILPVDDLKPHIEALECRCNPKIEIQDNGAMIVVHKSYDGRELKEQNVTRH